MITFRPDLTHEQDIIYLIKTRLNEVHLGGQKYNKSDAVRFALKHLYLGLDKYLPKKPEEK